MELLERADDLAPLTAAFDAAARGAGSVALILGEAGIGKSALVARLAADVGAAATGGGAWAGARVLWGACDALFTPRPLGPFHDVARQVGGRLLAATTAPAGREALFAAALDELQRARTPTLLVIEDAHWADEATLDLLKFLGRRITTTRALLVVTYRDDEVGPAHPLRLVLGDLPRAAVRRVRLRPLSPAAVATLARRAGKGAAGLHAATGGNPFYVTEVLAAGGDAGDAGDAELPATVRDAVLARAARLSPAARAVMQLASVVPARIEPWLVRQLLDPPPEALEECRAIGMTRLDDGALAFRHELARRAVEDALPAEGRVRLHADCLTALLARADAGDPAVSAARLVHHAERAGDADAVLRLGPVAAEQAAAVGAHREAASLYGLVLQRADALPPPARAELLERRAYECYLTDQIAQAIDARRGALAVWRAAGERRREGDALRWLSRLAWFAGDRAAAERHAAEAVATLAAFPGTRELAMAYSNLAQLSMLAGDVAAAESWGGRATAIAESIGDAEVLAHALNNIGAARYSAGRPEGRALLERSLALALAHGLHEHAARAYTNLCSGTVRARDYAAAWGWFEAGLAYCEARDLDSWTLYKLAWRARGRFETGDWTGAAEDADAVLRHPRSAVVSRIPAMAVLGRVRLHRGDPGWRALLDEARDLALGTAESQRVVPVAVARAEAAWLHGDAAGAAAELDAALALARARGSPWERGEAAAWAHRVGHPAAPPTPDLVAPYALEVAGDWRGAAAAWERLGCPYERALALLAGDEGAVRDALATLERLGAEPAAALARRRLRASGVRGVPRGARPGTRRNPARLTGRQLEILALVADGLRDAEIAERLFLSTKTVGHHVSAILAKLGARSRVEAAAAARELGVG